MADDAAIMALPIEAVLEELCAALRDRPNAVLVAPPGAGKSTRAPLRLLEEPWAQTGKILLLEPRRIAARAAAARMAKSLGEQIGQTIGFRVRMQTRVSAATRLEVVTEGVFTRMILADPTLDGVAGVLFDEFHERSLDADLGLALALDAQSGLREDLRLLVMSATLDGARVRSLLGAAALVQSEGRAFPVETIYLGRDLGEDVAKAMARACRRAMAEQTGSVLAFLPGQAEILRCADFLGEMDLDPAIEIAPLYGALDNAAQDRAIAPAAAGKRKIVLATAIAESALTIEGVSTVIDGGLARAPRFDAGTGALRLETMRVSRASADQRRGRAGRLGPGVCYRLWDEAQTRALPAFEQPEILSCDLASLALDLAEWGATPAALRWLDPPPAGGFAAAQSGLQTMGALDADRRLTDFGRRLRAFPAAPSLAAMVLQGGEIGALTLAADLAVLLSERGLGGQGVDLAARLQAFRRDQGAKAREARLLAQNHVEQARKLGFGAQARIADEAAMLMLLARAFPDRIAKARPGKPGEFLMANGRGAFVEETDPLARAPFAIIAGLTGAVERQRIAAALPLSEAQFNAQFRTAMVEADEAQFDVAAKILRGRRVRRLGAIVLAETPLAAPSGPAAQAALLEAVRANGLELLAWSEGATAFLARARFVAAAAPADWPDWSAAALAAELETWLGPFLAGARDFSPLADGALTQALRSRLEPAAQRLLDRLAPSHLTTPAGPTHPIDYGAEGGPLVEVRMGELYGLDRHPTVLDGKVALTLALLSPARRPIQLTKDLPGFWRGSYRAVRAEMRAYYPKHVWPEDPLAAAPTTRAKPKPG